MGPFRSHLGDHRLQIRVHTSILPGTRDWRRLTAECSVRRGHVVGG
jgi:hypothetical protein